MEKGVLRTLCVSIGEAAIIGCRGSAVAALASAGLHLDLTVALTAWLYCVQLLTAEGRCPCIFVWVLIKYLMRLSMIAHLINNP